MFSDFERNRFSAPPANLPLIPLVLGFIVSCALLSAAWPAARPILFHEDRIVEWATVIVFFGAFLTAIRSWFIGPRDDLLVASVGGLGLLGALDEISFGERLLDLSMPVVAGVKLDAAHDLLDLARVIIRETSETPYLVAGVGTVAVLAALLGIAWLLARSGFRWGTRTGRIRIAMAVLLVAIAVLLDLISTMRSYLCCPICTWRKCWSSRPGSICWGSSSMDRGS